MARAKELWNNIVPHRYLKVFNRKWHAGGPASSKQEDADQPEDDEVAGNQDLAEAVGPAAAAPPWPGTDYSGTGLSSDADCAR
eukprot:9380232-Pyramimonas_sp.AAC.1